MTDSDGLLLGIDVGGTKIAGVAVDRASGMLRAEHRQPIDGLPLERQVADVAQRLVADVGNGRPTAIGIAVPGLVDARSGVMRHAVNVGVGELAIGALVGEAVGAPCFVEHDARAAALWLADRGGATSLAYLSVGTGISAGIIVDDRLVRGVNGLAGEIGHTQVVADGPVCTCGLHGCLETVAAGPAVARLALEALEAGHVTTSLTAATAEAVYAAAAAGDPIGQSIANRVGVHLADAIRTIVLLYGIDRVVVGGGLSRAGASFIEPIMAELERQQSASPLIRHALASHPVELLPPDADPGAWGAVVVARSRLGDGTSPGAGREVADG